MFMERLKYVLTATATIGQLIGIVFLFINLKWAVFFYICYALAIAALFGVLIRERRKEKKEEEENDYRNY
jgi:hypothetical protein